ncbi:hypothetical protein GALL_306450 [mine drainage metagenome]|uniref:DUF535 domain-containing protein n=1 Tax=mine drainage metagenome TaxID=410659 RepID=A0A1J5QUX3_9ZZZZ
MFLVQAVPAPLHADQPAVGAPPPGRIAGLVRIANHARTLTRDAPLSEVKSFLTRAVLCPRRIAAHLEFVAAFQRHHGLAATGLRTAIPKPLKPYLTTGCPLPRRIALLHAHHRASAALPRAILHAVWGAEPLLVAHLTGVRGGHYGLWIEPAHHTRHEGEIALSFDELDPATGARMPLGRLTFLLGFDAASAPILMIGGLQGPRNAAAKAAIVTATRNLKGLRPKAALFLAAQAIAANCGCTAIHAVSNETHLINVRKQRARKRMTADYDAFWLERGGQLDGPLGYKMPLLAPDPKPFRADLVAAIAALFSAARAQAA